MELFRRQPMDFAHYLFWQNLQSCMFDSVLMHLQALFMITKISHRTKTMRIISWHKLNALYKILLITKCFIYKKTPFDSIKNICVNKLYFNKGPRPNFCLDVIFIAFVKYSCQKIFRVLFIITLHSCQ